MPLAITRQSSQHVTPAIKGKLKTYQTDVCNMSFIPLEVKDSSYAV